MDLSLGTAPLPWLLCLALGVGLCLMALWRRPPLLVRATAGVFGQVVLLTAPLAAVFQHAVYGAFPTIDKEGSLLFYLDGVHRRVLLDPLGAALDPAARLIGVHVGHLWVTEALDLVMTTTGAFSVQGLLYPALGWLCAALLLREVSGDGRVALVLGMPFGMGLHVFRDLNWYTIEKAAVFWLALFVWALYRSWRDGGRWTWVAALLFGVGAWMNLYLGLVGAAIGATALAWLAVASMRERTLLVPFRRIAWACLWCSALGLPLAVWQHYVMSGGPALGTPAEFLTQRAALDGFSLWPLEWNRLEAWRALDPIGLGLGFAGVLRLWREDGRVRFAAVTAALLFLLSLGPRPIPALDLANPVYMAAWTVVPGFWRVAKPEVFFEGSWLLLLAIGAVYAARLRPSTRQVALAYTLMVGTWLVTTRAHAVFPAFSQPVVGELDAGWERRVFGPSTTDPASSGEPPVSPEARVP
jgi:hypothetical protein